MNGRTTKQIAAAAAATLAALAAAWIVFDRAIYDRASAEPAAPAAQAPAAPAELEAIVDSVAGSVQRARSGSWADVNPGDRLRADDSVRTGKGAHAELRIGDRSHMTLAQSSQLVIRELTEKVHRFRLTRGHVHVEYAPDGARTLRIEGETGDAVAETRAAKFNVLSTGRAIAIATDSGEVELRSHGAAVHVEGGQQAVARAGEAPARPAAIPASLWLKVANALPAPSEGVCADVRGTAPAAAEVTVDGELIDVESDGRFSRRVPRAAGRSAVEVTIRDASGRTTTRTIPCSEDVADAKDVALRWHAPRAAKAR